MVAGGVSGSFDVLVTTLDVFVTGVVSVFIRKK